MDHINTLRIIVEQANEFQTPVYLLLVDFKHAFDVLTSDDITTTVHALGNNFVISLILFVLVLDWVMKKETRRVGEKWNTMEPF